VAFDDDSRGGKKHEHGGKAFDKVRAARGDKSEREYFSTHNSAEEDELVGRIEMAQTYAEGGTRTKVERDWDDEYKIFQGGGKQWETSKGPRSTEGRKRNFNSEDNLVFPMVLNMTAALTSSVPEFDIQGVEPEDGIAAGALNDLLAYLLDKNGFKSQWKKIVLQGIQYGPFIGYVPWDNNWIGGAGPDRWIGEVRIQAMKKSQFYPDPAILDLEERLQECSFINIKERKKLAWFAEQWEERGKYVIEDMLDLEKGMGNEGADPKQATLITHFHKGVPAFVPDEWKKEFKRRAEEAEADNLPYKAQEWRDMADGILTGVHCAYKAGGVLLDYVPYVYEDGLYPFIFKVLHADEKQPWGMGEIRNVVIPQILHNKADEIELGAMLSTGLGGGFYQRGALSASQRDELVENQAKPNMYIEVNDINGLQPRPVTQIPSYFTQYKEYKREMIDATSQNTDIQRGISPGANVPYASIQELGERGDRLTKLKLAVLEDFLIEMAKMVISRIAQFYTEDRTYRVLGNRQLANAKDQAYAKLLEIANMPQGTDPYQQLQAIMQLLMQVKTKKDAPKSATFNRRLLVRTWTRSYETGEDGEYVTDGLGNRIPKLEEFIPEFDIKVKVRDEKPTDRNYYTNLATNLIGAGFIGLQAYWKTIDTGKFPPIEEIVAEVQQMRQAQAQAEQQAQQTQQQAEQALQQAKDQASLQKIAAQNQSMEKQVAMSAQAKMMAQQSKDRTTKEMGAISLAERMAQRGQ